MLHDLAIRDILLIEALELEFRPGLNVLTGETGAGKSILLDSLGFALGWRGRADVVRPGAKQGEVSAVFELDGAHPARAVLEEGGLPQDDQLILRRISGADGRKRGFVNDRRVSGEVLRALSDRLVELHGQQDDRGLLDAKGHRQLLDGFGGLDAQRTTVRAAWRDWSAARRAKDEAEAALREAARDAEYITHAVRELDALDPQPGEDDALDARRRQMQMAGRIREDIERAFAAMGPGGAEGQLSDAMRWLESVAGKAEGSLDGALAALGRALIELGEAQGETEGLLRALDFDTSELEATEERLFAIRGLARKHNVPPDALAELAVDLRARLEAIDGGQERIGALAKEEAAAAAAYDKAAAALSKARAAAAKRLDKAMAGELPPLKLERAKFTTDVAELEAEQAGPEGRDAVAFTVTTNPGAPAGPINRIASGGELSRFLLALKVCLSARSRGLTMIFDEIDRGVGGATADAVGRRLARVAEGAQVLVVTHSPQVAAQAAHHFRVTKEVSGSTTRTLVDPLAAGVRVEELARMLAGDAITDEARAAAKALLKG